MSADDYAEPLAGMIRRGEIEPPDEFVMHDRFGPIEDGRDGCIEADDDDPWCNP